MRTKRFFMIDENGNWPISTVC